MADLSPGLLDAVKGFEGWVPRATWDYKQHTNGWGTRAQYPGEVVDQAEGQRRLEGELGKAAGLVGAFAPNLDAGTHAALTSLTYNAGNGWMNSGLGKAVQSGDMDAIRTHLLQYNKAGGATLPGLVQRRQAEAGWIGKPDALGGPPGYGPDGLNAVGPNGPQALSLLNIKQPDQAQPMSALGGPKGGGAPMADPYDNPRTQNAGGMNPLLMMGLGLLTSGMEGKNYSQGMLGGATAAQGFDSNRLQELNSERGWAIKQRELQRQQQADDLVRGATTNGALAKILPPEILAAGRHLPADQFAQLIQQGILQKQKQEADLALMNRKMQLAQDAYGGGEQPSMQPPQLGVAPQPPIPQIQPPQPAPAVGGPGRFAAPQLGGQPSPPPQPQAGGQMDPRRVAVLEAAGILPPGAAKVITEDPNYQIGNRRKAALANGYDLSDPSTQAYILNGKMPELVPDRKAIMEADQKVREGRKVAESLDLTSQYSKDAYSGFAAGPRAAIVNNTLPTESSKATANMDTEILTSMMPQLKAAFPGRITNNDIKLFESIQPSSGMTLEQRTQAIARAKQRVQQLISDAQLEADQLRGGTFYRKSGGVSGGGQPAAPPSAAPFEADGWKVERQ